MLSRTRSDAPSTNRKVGKTGGKKGNKTEAEQAEEVVRRKLQRKTETCMFFSLISLFL